MRTRPGQVLVLFLFLYPALWFVLLLPFSYGWTATARAVVRSGADGAALDCASQATLTKQVDARGEVYSETVTVRPNAGPQAAASWWRQAMLQAGFPNLYVHSWQVSVSGAVCVVRVSAYVTPPAGALFSKFETVNVGSAAKAVVPQ